MPYLYLISSVFLLASSSIFGSLYNKKNEGKKNTSALYTLLFIGSVFLFWLVLFLMERTVNAKILWYSVLFAVCYTICNIGFINALKTGSIILTTLILQFSLIGVTVWGFFFWNTQFSCLVGVGLTLVAVALWLCLYTGKAEKKKAINLKWIIFVIMTFVGNAGCSIIQKTQQMHFDGKYGSFLMMIATGISLTVCLLNYFKGDKSDAGTLFKTSWYFPVLAGLCNGILNLFIIFMATSTLSPSLIYPVLAIGGIAVTTIMSVFIFKEKIRWWQWIGVLVGTIAICFLSV